MPRPPKVDEVDYIQFLIAAQKVYTCTEAASCQPGAKHPQAQSQAAAAHDAFTRLLARRPPDTEALWQEVQALVDQHGGVLLLDDTTLDKPYARKIELVTRHWSGKHRAVVSGINLLTLLWTDGVGALPCDCRVYDKPLPEGKTKNEHFQDMLKRAKARGLAPALVCFDSWYSGLDNLKLVRELGWHFFTRLKHNRQVDPDGSGNVTVATLDIPVAGLRVHLKGFGFVRVFRTVAPHGDANGAAATTQRAQFWATSCLEMSASERDERERQVFAIENYHRGLKQCCGVERAQVRGAGAQKRHITLAVRAFVRLEVHRLRTGQSWYSAKPAIVRDAVRAYLAQPTIQLTATA
jgi:hypothetical protein